MNNTGNKADQLNGLINGKKKVSDIAGTNIVFIEHSLSASKGEITDSHTGEKCTPDQHAQVIERIKAAKPHSTHFVELKAYK